MQCIYIVCLSYITQVTIIMTVILLRVLSYESLVLTKESSLIRGLCQILRISRTDRSREFISYYGLFAV
jgi:hypothetical protein